MDKYGRIIEEYHINTLISLLFTFYFKSDERKVKLVSIELFHGRYVKTSPLKLQRGQLSSNLLQYFLEPFVIEETIGPEETDMECLRSIEVAVVVVKDVHVLEFLRGQDFLLEQRANELVGEGNKRI